MLAGIRTFISNYTNGMYFPHIQIIDIIEILIITVIVYEIMLWIKNTKAWMLMRGIVVLGIFVLLAAVFKMHTILFLARNSVTRHPYAWCVYSCSVDLSDEYDPVPGKGIDQCSGSCGGCCISAGTEKGFGETWRKESVQ